MKFQIPKPSRNDLVRSNDCRRCNRVKWHALSYSGFTLIELLVVIAIIAILAAMLLTVLAKAKARGQGIFCMNNLRQLQTAWLTYVQDNHDTMPPNDVASVLGQAGGPGSWVEGNAQVDSTTDNIQRGVLFGYVRALGVYRCPSDRSALSNPSGFPKTRSYSSSWWLNGSTAGGIANPSNTPEDKVKLSQIVSPGPSRIYVFIDEHEQSIDDGTLLVTSDNYFPPDQWWNLPADRHNQGCNLAFADGHVDPWRWKAPKKFQQYQQLVANRADHDDLYRLKASSIPDTGI